MSDGATEVKVRFDLDAVEHGATAEWLWAELVPDRLPLCAVLLNSPFHVRGVSHSDTVLLRKLDKKEEAQTGRTPLFAFAGVAARGGHSTYMILTPLECPHFAAYWSRLKALGCHYECGERDTTHGRMRLYSVDVPPETDVYAVDGILEQGAKDRVWMFRSGNIEHKAR